MSASDAALRIAMEVAAELEATGARAVILSGSHARADASPESDLDLYALGVGPAYTLMRHGGQLVSIAWQTPAAQRATFDDPARAGYMVPAWRRAVLMLDPAGLAAELQAEAAAWTWERIGRARCDRWAAEELTGYAEEVHKLITNRARGRWRVAGIQRSILAVRLARVLAPHFALVYESEDTLWDLVATRLGPSWERAQAAALGEGGEALAEACKAALELFVLAAQELAPSFDARQRAVVGHACALAGGALDTAGG